MWSQGPALTSASYLRPQTGRKRAHYSPCIQHFCPTEQCRALQRLLFTPTINNLINKPCLYSSGFQITWLAWASPRNGEITPAYAGTSKKEEKGEKKASLANTKMEFKILVILHHLRLYAWITSKFYFPVIKHSSLQQEHQADI